MTWPFTILAVLTLASAVAAMSLRNLVHCALMLMVTFAGLAAFYLQLDAQFVGFAQILIYIGAVAILIVFAILLTRGSEPPRQSIFSGDVGCGRRHSRSRIRVAERNDSVQPSSDIASCDRRPK